MEIDEPMGRFMSCCLRLLPVELEIVHRPGRKNQVLDAVSRLTGPSAPIYKVDDHAIPRFEDALLAVTT